MMLRPTYPKPDTYTPAPMAPAAPVVPVGDTHAPACTCHHTPTTALAPASASNRPTVQLTPAGAVAVVAGGAGVVLVVGAVLVSMLLAVAITASSVAVCAVVLRLLLSDRRSR